MVSPGISVKEVASAVTGANPFMQSGRVDTKRNRTVVIVDDESTGRLILGKIIQQVALILRSSILKVRWKLWLGWMIIKQT